jgi:ketosteroid isomerase-like protein
MARFRQLTPVNPETRRVGVKSSPTRLYLPLIRGKNVRYFVCLLAALCISVSTLRATDDPKLSPEQQEVFNVSQARRDANNRRDMKAAAAYIADDCLFSTDDGTLITKAQYLKFGQLPVEYDHSTNVREIMVRVYGNTAVINFRITGHEQFGDVDIISEQRRTETWLKQNGAWVLIAVQWGNVPVNFRRPVSVNANTYNDYVGQFELRRGLVDNVFVKDGKLWSRLDEDEGEYLPLGSDTFFVKDDLGSITFVRDAQGHVTSYTYNRADGQEIHAKKVK